MPKLRRRGFPRPLKAGDLRSPVHLAPFAVPCHVCNAPRGGYLAHTAVDGIRDINRAVGAYTNPLWRVEMRNWLHALLIAGGVFGDFFLKHVLVVLVLTVLLPTLLVLLLLGKLLGLGRASQPPMEGESDGCHHPDGALLLFEQEFEPLLGCCLHEPLCIHLCIEAANLANQLLLFARSSRHIHGYSVGFFLGVLCRRFCVFCAGFQEHSIVTGLLQPPFALCQPR
mmetsp:Transcript_88561/g.143433  ORF Transcript_88561/g.143433 Transcript_88561/m.143433 type:complete len:226 (-) Transcript_88561:101-778(-)